MNLFRILVLSLAVISSCVPTFAQKDKNVIYRIGVHDFAYTPPGDGNKALGVVLEAANVLLNNQSSKQQPQFAPAVRASILSGLSKVNLFRPTDGDILESELTDNLPILFADGTIANVGTVSKTKVTQGSGSTMRAETSHLGIIRVTVNLKNAYDGTLVDSHTFNITESDSHWMSSDEKAIDNALEQLTGKIAEYYNNLFPLHASVIERGEAKKDKQKEVYIDLGSNDGVVKGLQLDVYVTGNVAGRETRTNIGRIKIEEVQGEEISLCKVTKGADKVKTALDEGKTLVVTTH